MAVSDNCDEPGELDGEFVHERILLATAAAARSIGIDIDLAALAPTRRCKGPDALVPAREHLAVMRAIFCDPRETLGIDLAQHLPIEGTGLWGFLLRSSASFGEMLGRAERYIRVANRYREFRLEDRGERIALVSPHPDPSPYGRREQVVCAHLGHWIAWGRQLTGAPVSVSEARMRWAGPRDPGPFARFFGGAVRFRADEDALLLERSILALPLPDYAPELSSQLEAYAAVLIRALRPQRDAAASFVDRVHAALAQATLTDAATETYVAGRLAVTPRTLHRRLKAAGTSFRALRTAFLRERAQALLREERIPIAEVSYLLGYADPSTFHRAFRRWTGVTPAEWRARG